MTIRLIVCTILVLWLCLEAWRGKWFWSACGAVVMMAFLERKDMPRSILGIPGLNLWNVLMINTTWAWLVWRRSQELVWDFPEWLKKWALLYVFVIVWAFTRFFIDPTAYYNEGRFTIVV